jgi:hypothetical protein
MTVGRGRDTVTEQFRSAWSPGEQETGAVEMFGPDGIAEYNFLVEAHNFIKTPFQQPLLFLLFYFKYVDALHLKSNGGQTSYDV